MAIQYNEVAVASDPEAYNEVLIDNTVVAKEYNTATDRIVYNTSACAGGSAVAIAANTHETQGSPFRTLRVNMASGKMDRSVIIEEAFDTPAPATIFGGMVAPSGSFEGAFRPWDMGGKFGTGPTAYFSPLMLGIMGYQIPAEITSKLGDGEHGSCGCGTSVGATDIDGYRYKLTTLPATLSLKIVDVTARRDAGSGGTHVFRGVGIQNAEIRLESMKYAMIKADFMARKEEVHEASYASGTDVTGTPALFYNPVLKWTPDGGSAEAFKCTNFTISLARSIDTQKAAVLGSPYITNIIYSSMVALKGTIGLDPAEWKRLRSVAAGSADITKSVIDEGHREFFGNTCDANAMANAIPSGKLEITLQTHDGTRPVAYICMVTAKLTNMDFSKQGQNPQEKSIEFQAQVATENDFYIDVFELS